MNPNSAVLYQDTHILIQDVFGELMQEKPLPKITVKDICERAKIHRSTFYAHFEDINDLYARSILFILARFFQGSKESGEWQIRESLLEQLSFLYEYRHVIQTSTAKTDMAAMFYSYQ